MVATLPLTGIKVADFSWFGAGPICAQNLARYGQSDTVRDFSHVLEIGK